MRYNFWLSSLRARCSGPRTGKDGWRSRHDNGTSPRDYELLSAEIEPPDSAGYRSPECSLDAEQDNAVVGDDLAIDNRRSDEYGATDHNTR
jgi:hypothetical protein